MNPTALFEPAQRLFDTAKDQGRVTDRTKFLVFKSLVAKVNLSPTQAVAAADIEIVADTKGKVSTYRLFMLLPQPEHGASIYRAIMVEHLFEDQPPEMHDAVYEVDAQAGTYKQRTDLTAGEGPDGQEVARTIIMPYLQSAQILEGDSPAQPILRMVSGVQS